MWQLARISSYQTFRSVVFKCALTALDYDVMDVMNFEFKGFCVRCVVYGSIDYQTNLFLVHTAAK